MDTNTPEFKDKLGNLLFNFVQVPGKNAKVDCIIVFGNYDVSVAKRAAQLYKEGVAPIIVITGGKSRLSPLDADVKDLKKRVIRYGVPKDKIYSENKSVSTHTSIINTKRLLKKNGIKVESAMFVCLPPLEKRVYAMFRVKWPEIDVYAPKDKIKYEEYADKIIDKEEVLNLCVGEISRYILYPKRGWMAPQPLSLGAIDAYNRLVGLGYKKYLETP